MRSSTSRPKDSERPTSEAVKAGKYRIGMGAFGESLARDDNFVSIDPKLKDAWGIPALHISMTHGDNEKALMEMRPRLLRRC